MEQESFNEKVYVLLKKVPKGKVTTYKALANRMGTKAYRAVGRAMRCNPYAPKVPCHRVVSADGTIGGFSGTKELQSPAIRKKIMLLKKEGVSVKGNKIVDFEKVLY